MEGEEVSRTLPEDLVERILIMVPFPQIFKARVLSKSWLARLSPVLSHEDEDKKQIAISFQKRLCEYSTKWQTFSPAFVGKKDLIAYDKASQHWRTFPTLSFIQKNLTTSEYSCMRILAMKGALMLITTRPKDLYVANVITRTWKRLPTAPNTDRYYPGKLAVEADTFKVILLYRDGGYLFGQIYDSELGAWSCNRTGISGELRFTIEWDDPPTESLAGVSYSLVYDLEYKPWGFLVFNVKEQTFQVIQNPHIHELLPAHCFHKLVVCNDSLIVGSVDTNHEYTQIATFLKVDMVSGSGLEVIKGPPDDLEFSKCFEQATSDGKSIFIQDINLKAILAYDVHKEEWSSFPSPPEIAVDCKYREYEMDKLFSFQPGLNPFFAL